MLITGNFTAEEVAEERGIPASQVDVNDARAAVVHGTQLKVGPISL